MYRCPDVCISLARLPALTVTGGHPTDNPLLGPTYKTWRDCFRLYCQGHCVMCGVIETSADPPRSPAKNKATALVKTHCAYRKHKELRTFTMLASSPLDKTHSLSLRSLCVCLLESTTSMKTCLCFHSQCAIASLQQMTFLHMRPLLWDLLLIPAQLHSCCIPLLVRSLMPPSILSAETPVSAVRLQACHLSGQRRSHAHFIEYLD